MFTACYMKPANNARKDIVLLSNSDNKASSVSFTTDESGKPVVSWCETNKQGNKYFFLSYLDNDANAFSNPVQIPVAQNTNLHEEGMPKIAIKNDGTIVAIYETSNPAEENKFAGFVKYIQSFDKGKTWTGPAFLHADTTAGKSHSFASIARLSDGEIGACWLDVSLGNKKGGRSVKFSKTTGRNGFAGEMLIDSFACQCCRTAINCDAAGNIAIMFRDVLQDSIRDMSVCTSADDGKTFGRPVAFTNDRWVINGCPHNGPSIVRRGDRSFASWYTGGMQSGLYYAEMNNKNEITDRKMISNSGRNIQLCVLNDSRIVVYNEMVKTKDSFFSKIAVNKISGKNMWTLDISRSGQGAYPVLHPADDKSVAVAWEDNGALYYRIVEASNITKPVEEAAINPLAVKREPASINLAVKKDLVCGMPVSAGVKDTTLYKGKIYGFCAKECKDEFVKDPAHYIVGK